MTVDLGHGLLRRSREPTFNALRNTGPQDTVRNTCANGKPRAHTRSAQRWAVFHLSTGSALCHSNAGRPGSGYIAAEDGPRCRAGSLDPAWLPAAGRNDGFSPHTSTTKLRPRHVHEPITASPWLRLPPIKIQEAQLCGIQASHHHRGKPLDQLVAEDWVRLGL